MSNILAFPRARDGSRGIVHVMPRKSGGFEIGHESASGNSWGFFAGPFDRGQTAIAAAYALNRDQLDGSCNVAICHEALADIAPSGFEREDI